MVFGIEETQEVIFRLNLAGKNQRYRAVLQTVVRWAAHLVVGVEGVSAGRGASALPSLWRQRLPPSSGSIVAPCNLHSRWFHGELRYAYVQWPTSHLVLRTRCGCAPIRVAHPHCVVWLDERWLDEKSPNRSHRFVGRGAAFLGVKPIPLFFSSSQEDRSAGCARRLAASFSHGRGCRLSSTSWCPLPCGRGLGLGPQRRDPLVSGSTSPSVD